MDALSSADRNLLADVDQEPRRTDRSTSQPAQVLEAKLLVYSEQLHTEAGVHVRRLESWGHCCIRSGYAPARMPVPRAKQTFEDAVSSLNKTFQGHARLPWL